MASGVIRQSALWAAGMGCLAAACFVGGESAAEPPLEISGIYPHLATYNQPEDVADRPNHGECGIGAIVPWADRLWYLTYPQHKTTGSNDKLYEVDDALNRVIRPESVGGTHASRMIHRESNQLIIGPYFIDAERNVRAADLKQLRGRMTAVMRHLEDPANKVYFFDMEGAIYEVDVHTLAVTKLFNKPVPGWHGKGGYTAQHRVVIANNGERDGSSGLGDLLVGGPPVGEEAGVLAEWDGTTWRIVERKQFLDVTGPGGIYGSPDDTSPLWAIGWDKRSVILKLLDGGRLVHVPHAQVEPHVRSAARLVHRVASDPGDRPGPAHDVHARRDVRFSDHVLRQEHRRHPAAVHPPAVHPRLLLLARPRGAGGRRFLDDGQPDVRPGAVEPLVRHDRRTSSISARAPAGAGRGWATTSRPASRRFPS